MVKCKNVPKMKLDLSDIGIIFNILVIQNCLKLLLIHLKIIILLHFIDYVLKKCNCFKYISNHKIGYIDTLIYIISKSIFVLFPPK